MARRRSMCLHGFFNLLKQLIFWMRRLWNMNSSASEDQPIMKQFALMFIENFTDVSTMEKMRMVYVLPLINAEPPVNTKYQIFCMCMKKELRAKDFCDLCIVFLFTTKLDDNS